MNWMQLKRQVMQNRTGSLYRVATVLEIRGKKSGKVIRDLKVRQRSENLREKRRKSGSLIRLPQSESSAIL